MLDAFRMKKSVRQLAKEDECDSVQVADDKAKEAADEEREGVGLVGDVPVESEDGGGEERDQGA